MPCFSAKRRKKNAQSAKKKTTGRTQERMSESQLLSVAPANVTPLPFSSSAKRGSTRVVEELGLAVLRLLEVAADVVLGDRDLVELLLVQVALEVAVGHDLGHARGVPPALDQAEADHGHDHVDQAQPVALVHYPLRPRPTWETVASGAAPRRRRAPRSRSQSTDFGSERTTGKGRWSSFTSASSSSLLKKPSPFVL